MYILCELTKCRRNIVCQGHDSILLDSEFRTQLCIKTTLSLPSKRIVSEKHNNPTKPLRNRSTFKTRTSSSPKQILSMRLWLSVNISSARLLKRLAIIINHIYSPTCFLNYVFEYIFKTFRVKPVVW